MEKTPLKLAQLWTINTRGEWASFSISALVLFDSFYLGNELSCKLELIFSQNISPSPKQGVKPFSLTIPRLGFVLFIFLLGVGGCHHDSYITPYNWPWAAQGTHCRMHVCSVLRLCLGIIHWIKFIFFINFRGEIVQKNLNELLLFLCRYVVRKYSTKCPH